jgi:hypothetical protein
MLEQVAGPLESSPDPSALQVLGFTHLMRAHQAVGLHDPATAGDHLDEAARIAAHTGEADDWDLYWGPRNVALWRLAHLVDTGAPGEAVEAVAGVDVAGMIPQRQVYAYTDLARALADLRRNDEALRMLLAAEKAAPQHARSSPACREAARNLLHEHRRTSSLYGLCERFGVAD